MKIAIVGTASHTKEAPFKDKDWKIWGVSGVYVAKKEGNTERNQFIDRIYELHAPSNLKETCEPRDGYIDFVKGLKENFIIQDNAEIRKRYPDATVFNHKALVEKHGHGRYFTSSIAWMIADAIEILERSDDKEKVIGIWGVNMAHDSEYGYQKPGCLALQGYAEGRGITVTGHPNSELFVELPLYAVEELPPVFKNISYRKKDLEVNLKREQHNEQTAVQTINFLNGALAEYDYIGKVEADKRIETLKKEIEKFRKSKEEASQSMIMWQGALDNTKWMELNYFKHAG